MNGGSCNINVNLTNNVDLTGKSVGLQCAVVKNSIDVSGTSYYNCYVILFPIQVVLASLTT
jgi:hypothetical protein